MARAHRVPRYVDRALAHLLSEAMAHESDDDARQRRKGRDLHDAYIWLTRLVEERRRG